MPTPKRIMEIDDNESVPTSQEVAQLVASIIKEVQKAQAQMQKLMQEHRDEMSGYNAGVMDDVYKKSEEMNGMLSQYEKEMKNNFSTLKESISSSIEEVKLMIPELPPEVDLTDIYNSLKEIEAKIPKIPDEITAEVIIKKLEAVEENEDKLSIDAIKDLREELKKMRKIVDGIPRGGGIVGRDIIKDIDISSQLDGVLKTFNIQGVWNIISIDLSSFPYGSLRKGVDYTWTTTSITFTSEINASTQLASGQSCILTVVTQ